MTLLVRLLGPVQIRRDDPILAEILGESFLTSTWDTRLLLPSENEVLLDDP